VGVAMIWSGRAYKVPSCWLACVAQLVVGGQDEENFRLRSHIECQLMLECTNPTVSLIQIFELMLAGKLVEIASIYNFQIPSKFC
jgi:hypothetical protein